MLDTVGFSRISENPGSLSAKAEQESIFMFG